jgi:hypothetical protein
MQPQIRGFDGIDFLNIRFSLNRDAAPEKVNATIKPNRAKTAPSTVPRLPRSPSDSFGRRLTPNPTAGFQQDQHAKKQQQSVK